MLRQRRSRRGQAEESGRRASAEVLEPRRLLSAETWSQVARLTASDGTAHDLFGQSVAVNGSHALVGRPFDDNGLGSGSAYLYDVATGQPIAKFKPDDAAARDRFGSAVALGENFALVGSPFDDDNGASSGSVYLFDLTTGSQVSKLKPIDGTAGDQFGSSVAVSGNIALIGSYGRSGSGTGSGSAYLFDVITGTQLSLLLPDDAAPGQGFGVSVSMSGTTALVGSYLDHDNGYHAGSAYLFDVTTGTQIAKLMPSDGAAEDWFGASVSVSGNTALVGSRNDDDNDRESGSAYLFDVITGQQTAKLKPADGAALDRFGFSVALSGNTAFIGSIGDDDDGFGFGSTYVFDVTTFQQVTKLKPALGGGIGNFGCSIALVDGTAVIGAVGSNSSGSSGRAYVFKRNNSPWPVSTSFGFATSLEFVVRFDVPVDPASLDLTAVTATGVEDSTKSHPAGVTWSAGNTVASFNFNGLGNGHYFFSMAAGSVADMDGNPLSTAAVYDSPDAWVLAGDANRDRRVNASDLWILAQHYGRSGRTFLQGNFDYSADGRVDFSDLLILSQNFSQALPFTPSSSAKRVESRRVATDVLV